jgi:cobalt-zinc-cadmium efflux system membrane fusion protein
VPVKIGRKTDTALEVLEGVKSGQKLAGKGSYYLKAELQKGELEEE